MIIHEEDVVHLLECRIQFHITGAAYRCLELVNVTRISGLKRSSTLCIGPANEFVAGLLRRCRCINCFTIFYLLRGNILSIRVMKDVGSDRWILLRGSDSGNNINRELARLKARSLSRSICDLACVAVVIDVQDLMAVAAHIS